jgi:(1->4)-alpha-D-glucan 1-alpha-D-glucosylmutase
VAVVPAGAGCWHVPLRLPLATRTLRWQLTDEGGLTQHGEADASALHETARTEHGGAWLCERTLPMSLPLAAGYHRLRIDGLPGETLVLATPGHCYRPPAVRDGRRVWGPAVQLYSLRSPRNWGIGDFSDLDELVTLMAAQGADIVGLNPLHALFSANPAHASPYSPSSREQLNVLYIDVEAVDGFADCEPARHLVHSPAFQARLAALRAQAAGRPARRGGGQVRGAGTAVRALSRNAPARAGAPDDDGLAFLAFVAERGEGLRQHALVRNAACALPGHRQRLWGWPVWPAAYRDPDSAEVTAFAVQHAQRLQFHQFLQWQAARQLAQASARCEAVGMGVGLYVDLAVSVDRAGSDAWTAQGVLAAGASIGAPPDEFNPAGQNWGLPPLRPDSLRADGYRFFMQTLRAGMRGAGALRIDHVMGLMRLFWIPPGRGAQDGAYVYYPLDEMLAIVAIESHRHRCMVVGEDLGTVEDAVREALAKADVLSYRLLYFEKFDGQHHEHHAGGFKPPEAYPAAALVAVSTHDLATFAGWWAGHDLRVRLELGLFPDERVFDKQLLDRAQERIQLMLAAERGGLLSREEVAEAAGQALPSTRVVEAVHAYLGAAPSALMMVQLEDAAGVVEQANMPGTVSEQPNWRRKLPVASRALAESDRMQGISAHLRAVRPGLRSRTRPSRRRRCRPACRAPPTGCSSTRTSASTTRFACCPTWPSWA